MRHAAFIILPSNRFDALDLEAASRRALDCVECEPLFTNATMKHTCVLTSHGRGRLFSLLFLGFCPLSRRYVKTPALDSLAPRPLSPCSCAGAYLCYLGADRLQVTHPWPVSEALLHLHRAVCRSEFCTPMLFRASWARCLRSAPLVSCSIPAR